MTNKQINILALSISLVLFPIHNANQPLYWMGIHLPLFALIFMIVATANLLLDKDWMHLKFNWGSKWVYIPMLLIVASAWLRAIVYWNAKDLMGGCLMTAFFGMYLVARDEGETLLKAFPWATIIGAISVIVIGLIFPGLFSGGIISSLPSTVSGHWANYDLAMGVLVYGWLLSRGKYQWLLAGLVLVALFFTGAVEALYVVGIIVVAALVRKDWDVKRYALIIVVLLAVVSTWFALGYGQKLWFRVPYTIQSLDWPQDKMVQPNGVIRNPFWARLIMADRALDRIEPLGYGIEIAFNTWDTTHNVPLIIVDQLGIVAGISWAIVTLYCLKVSKWRYLWIAIIAMSIGDHFIWTQLAPYWWVCAGMSTIEGRDIPLIFKRELTALRTPVLKSK